MYSLRTQEKLDAEQNHTSSRQVLWKHLNDKKKSGRMIRRIYQKTREEMAESCRTRSGEWVDNASTNIRRWVRDPQSLVFSGGGELDKEKTADLMETLLEPSHVRGNHPNALQNPCRPTVTITDTAKIRGRVEHPHWEPPRYFLRPREKAKEIGPDVQYADRNDMQRIFSAVVKYSLFPWGEYKERGAGATSTCRRESPEKWMGDRPFHPGFRYRDNQWESMAGVKNPPNLLNDGDYKPPQGFSRGRHPSKELPQHERFRLVVKNGEYACPDGDIRRSLRFEEEPSEPYPDDKMYFASLRSVPINPATHKLRVVVAGNQPRDGASLLRKSRSLETLPRRPVGGDKTMKGKSNPGTGNAKNRGGESQDIRRGGPADVWPLLVSRSSTAVRFSGNKGESETEVEQLGEEVGGSDVRGAVASTAETVAIEGDETCDEKVAREMRRGSEMASWAVCGTSEKSARDYLW